LTADDTDKVNNWFRICFCPRHPSHPRFNLYFAGKVRAQVIRIGVGDQQAESD
jgi:hypothetical protein